jgi:hypothetical protein
LSVVPLTRREQLATDQAQLQRKGKKMPPVFRDDPYTAYNFEVTVDGVSDDGQAVKGSFTEAMVGDTTIDPIATSRSSAATRATSPSGTGSSSR